MDDAIECLEKLKQELGDLKTKFHEADQRIKNLEEENAFLKSRIEEESTEIEALKTEIKFYSTGARFGWEHYHAVSERGAVNDYFVLAKNFREKRDKELSEIIDPYRPPNKKTEELINAVIGMATRKKGKSPSVISYSEIKRELGLSDDQMKRLSPRLRDCEELFVDRPKKGRGQCYVGLAH